MDFSLGGHLLLDYKGIMKSINTFRFGLASFVLAFGIFALSGAAVAHADGGASLDWYGEPAGNSLDWYGDVGGSSLDWYGGYDTGCDWSTGCGGGYYDTGGCDWSTGCGGGYVDNYNTGCDWTYGCGGGYYGGSAPYYSDYSWDWNYDWGFEDSYQYEYEEYVYEWDYDWHFEEDYDYCDNIRGNQPRGYDCYPDRHDDEPRCELDASDTSIEDGDDVTLRWESDDASSARLNEGIGSVSLDGSRRVSPDEDTTYVLTVRDDDGDTDTCSVTVRVEEEDNNDDLWCRLTASDRTVEEGDEITLEWDTRGAERASINQGIGRVDEDGGEEDVEVDEDTTFRLTVEDEDGDEETCSVTVRVDDERNFSSVVFEGEPTNNPPVVYLSSLPYTGIEDIDPAMLTFYAMLVALLGALGWAAYRSGMIPSFAFAHAEPIDEGHADGHVEEGPTEEAAEVLAKLGYGDAEGALSALRKAAVNGAGVEETLESALRFADDSAKATVAAALTASRANGIRGAKDAFGA